MASAAIALAMHLQVGALVTIGTGDAARCARITYVDANPVGVAWYWLELEQPTVPQHLACSPCATSARLRRCHRRWRHEEPTAIAAQLVAQSRGRRTRSANSATRSTHEPNRCREMNHLACDACVARDPPDRCCQLKAAGPENCSQSTVQYPSAPHDGPKYSSSVTTTQYLPAGGLVPTTELCISEYEEPPARSWLEL